MLTQGGIDNAVVATMAFGGSTNAIPHLIAIARRAGLQLDLARFDAISYGTCVLHEGCAYDFLEAAQAAPEPEIY